MIIYHGIVIMTEIFKAPTNYNNNNKLVAHCGKLGHPIKPQLIKKNGLYKTPNRMKYMECEIC